MLSVISTVKGRPEGTILAFNSIWENADKPQEIEHLIAMDCATFSENTELHELVNEYRDFYKQLGIRVLVNEVCFCQRPEQYEFRNLHREYWNPLAKEAKGDIIFGLTNDCVIQTKGFDTILFDAFEEHKEKHKHDVVQFLIDDDSASTKTQMRPSAALKNDTWKSGNIDKLQALKKSQDKAISDFCQWVILSKSAVDIMGGIIPDEIQLEGGDTYVDSIFKNTILPSQLDLTSQIITEDHSHHTGRSDEDEKMLGQGRPNRDQRAEVEKLFIESKRPYDAKINLEIARQAYNLQWKRI